MNSFGRIRFFTRLNIYRVQCLYPEVERGHKMQLDSNRSIKRMNVRPSVRRFDSQYINWRSMIQIKNGRTDGDGVSLYLEVNLNTAVCMQVSSTRNISTRLSLTGINFFHFGKKGEVGGQFDSKLTQLHPRCEPTLRCTRSLLGERSNAAEKRPSHLRRREQRLRMLIGRRSKKEENNNFREMNTFTLHYIFCTDIFSSLTSAFAQLIYFLTNTLLRIEEVSFHAFRRPTIIIKRHQGKQILMKETRSLSHVRTFQLFILYMHPSMPTDDNICV